MCQSAAGVFFFFYSHGGSFAQPSWWYTDDRVRPMNLKNTSKCLSGIVPLSMMQSLRMELSREAIMKYMISLWNEPLLLSKAIQLPPGGTRRDKLHPQRPSFPLQSWHFDVTLATLLWLIIGKEPASSKPSLHDLFVSWFIKTQIRDVLFAYLTRTHSLIYVKWAP